MRGKKAKRLRFEAYFVAFEKVADTTQTVAPQVMRDIPAHSLLKDTQTGTIIVPPTCGRFWYQLAKRGGQLGEVGQRSLKLLAS